MSGRHELKADILVIGGGIVGCATALHLVKRGKSVILLERDQAGMRASGVNFGGVRQHGRATAELPLSRRARGIWGNLRSLIGIDGDLSDESILSTNIQSDNLIGGALAAKH